MNHQGLIQQIEDFFTIIILKILTFKRVNGENYEIINPSNIDINQYFNTDDLYRAIDNDIFRFDNKYLFDINKKFSFPKFLSHYEESYKVVTGEEGEKYSELFKKLFLKEEDIINILKDPYYIIKKTKFKKQNLIYTGLTKSCVIGSFVHNKKSLFIILLLIHFLWENRSKYDEYGGRLYFKDFSYECEFRDGSRNVDLANLAKVYFSTLTSVQNEDFKTLFTIGFV